MHMLGLANYFWSNNKKPYLSKYYSEVIKRKSFQRSLPSTIATMKTIWHKLPSTFKWYAIGFTVIVVGVTIYELPKA